jgi:hypothetical protein
MNARDVIPRPASFLAECGITGIEQIRNRVMAGHICPRVHQTDDRLFASLGVEYAFRLTTILGQQWDRFVRYA